MSLHQLKQLVLRFLPALVPILIVMGVFLFPYLLKNNPVYTTQSFQIKTQISQPDGIHLTGNFTEQMEEHDQLWFFAENARIEFKVQDKRIVFNTLDETPSQFHSPGRNWHAYSTSKIDPTNRIEVTISSYYGKHQDAVDSFLKQFYLNENSGLFKIMLNQFGFIGLIQLIALIAGLIYMSEGAIYILSGMKAEGIRIGIFGFYTFSGGLWCVSDHLYPFLSILLHPSWMAMLIDMLGLLLFPIAIAAMMRYSMYHTKTKKMMNFVLFLEIMVALSCVFIQSLGIKDLFELQEIMSVIALFCLILAIYCVYYEIRLYRDSSLWILVFTALPVFIVIFIDIFNVLWPFMDGRHIMSYGFSLSVFIMLSHLANYAQVEMKKEKTLQKMELELSHARISMMLSQIQPHFLYNALLGIKQLCDTDSKRASDALEHFSYYLRGNLDSISNDQLITFDKEMNHVQDYLYLEKMRFSKKIQIVYDITYQDFLIPPLTIQPLVENAVRYGIVKKKGGGTLSIHSEKTSDHILVMIQDDGVGFDCNQEYDDGRSHLGIANVRNRLAALCSGELLVESEIGRGTIVKIILPKKEEKL